MSPMFRRAVPLAAAVLAVSLACGTRAHATSDTYLCHGARAGGGFTRATGLDLLDHVTGTRTVDARRPHGVCAPARIGGWAHVKLTLLERYRARLTRTRPRQPRADMPELTLSGSLGLARVRLTRSLQLLVPTSLDLGSHQAPALTPHFQCYRARTIAPHSRRRLDISDYFGRRLYDVGNPTRFCARADKNGESPDALTSGNDLLCYRARVARTRPRQHRYGKLVLDTVNQLGTDQLRLGPTRELCVPVIEIPLPTPSPAATPQPTVTTGAATLERITIRPPEIARLPTEVKHFWATGHFSNGATRDMTDEVVWATGDPNVATAPNDPNAPNRIELHATGTTHVSATDPASGVGSAASGDDAILRVTGPLSYIEVHPRYARVSKSGFEQFTAVGCYRPGENEPGCVFRNITQDVTWLTSVAGVADAENREGDRSRIIGLKPGVTGVHARDPATGITSTICTNPLNCHGPVLAVLGALQSIELVGTGRPRTFFRLPVGARARVAAIGRHEGGGFRHVTQESTLLSSDEGVFTTPNIPGDRGVFEVAGGGEATLFALHSPTGILSAPFPHFGFGNIIGITTTGWRTLPLARPVGPVIPFGCCEYTKGIYPGGRRGPLFDWTLSVDDPTIARVDGRLLVGLRTGTVAVAIRDIPTGIESEPRLVTFFGELNRLELAPPAVALRVGDEDQLSAVFDYDGNHQETVTQTVDYASSDPSIVEAPNAATWPPHRSRIIARAPGEATISAIGRGISTDDSGDSTHVTVVGDLTSLTISPAQDRTGVGRSQQFTATGTDAAGRSINLTQVVDWSTSDASIAEATNTDGDKSRIHGRAPGAVTVHALDPVTGLSSTASGGDATLTVLGPVGSLLLLPESLPLLPGSDFQLTTLGVAPDGTLNITQQVDYSSDDPSVVAISGTEDDESRITAVGPGTARITATDPVTGLISNETLVTVPDPGP